MARHDHDSAGADGGRTLSWVVLGATSLAIVGVAIQGWWNDRPPLGDDASSHIVMLARIAEALRTGAGWWAPDFNLGFPIGLYYQPLPHFVGGVITALLGGGVAAIAVYKALSAATVALLPWGVAAGGRALGMSRAAATCAGVVAPMVVSTLGFGLTTQSSLSLALHTQAWAAVLLPIALGQMARALDGQPGASLWAVVSWVLVCLCHFFYGLGVAAIAALWVLCRPPAQAPRRALRLAAVGALTGVCLLFWLVPLLASLEAMGGWPFGSGLRTNGYGLGGFLEPLLSGDVLDGEGALPALSVVAATGLLLCFSQSNERSLPVDWLARGRVAAAGAGGTIALTLAFVDGPPRTGLVVVAILFAAVALSTRLRPLPSPAGRLLLAMAVLTGLFTIGRAGLGSLVDVFVFNRAVQMFRYLGLFHLACIWLAGWAMGWLLMRARTRRGRGVVALGLAVVLAPAISRAATELAVGFRTVDDADVDLDQYHRLTDALARTTRTTGAGRLFVHPRSGLRGHYHSGLLALWDGSDAGESYGVGLHDSLNFYYLEFFHPERRNTRPELMDLYGFQTVAADGHRDFSHLGAERVFASDAYTVWRLSRRVSLCAPIDTAAPVEGFPRDRRRTIRAWLNGNGPEVGVFPLLEIPPGVPLGHSTDAPVEVDGSLRMTAPDGPAGHLRLAQRAPDRHLCRVDMERPGAVLFRVGYHPYWRARVDGQPAPVEYAFPAFMAVEVGPGPHEVSIRYELPAYVHPLLALGLLVPLGMAAAGRRRRAVRRS